MADTAITISDDRVSVLTAEEQAAKGFTHRFRVLYSDIALGAGTTDTVTMTLGATPAKFLIDRALVNVTTAFAGAASQALTIKVGATDDDFAVAAVSVFTAGIKQPTNGPSSVAAPAGGIGVTAQTLKAIFTNATAGSPSELTAGELYIYLRILNTAADLA